MSSAPEHIEQIRQAHAGLIHRVVIAAQNRAMVPDLDEVLRQAETNGWRQLVAAVRRILKGERALNRLRPLDEEDEVIVSAILMGLQNPSTLPDLGAAFDAGMAAPGLAALIHAARQGRIEALETIATMAAQMLQAGGDMARLAGNIRPLVKGERDPERLTQGMGDKGEQLMLGILRELARLEGH